MKKPLVGLILLCLLAACGDTAPDNPSNVKADDLEIVTLTESSQGNSLYFDVAVKNTSDLTLSSASVKFSLLYNKRVVDSGSAFYENVKPDQETSTKAAFYDVLKTPGAYSCYRYEVTVSSGGADTSETKSYDGTCN